MKEVGAARGTTAEVRDLFFNTPARLKFLKSRETELSHIAATVERLALAHPMVHFRLTSDGKELFDCPPVRELRERVAQVYGRDFAKGLSEINNGGGACRVHGFVSAPGSTFSDRSRQETFVNHRPVKDRVITRALYDAYESLLMKERHPASILFIDIEPSQVDVNVHPAKREVRFADAQGVQRTIKEAVICALKSSECAPGADAFMDAGTVREAPAPFAPPYNIPSRFPSPPVGEGGAERRERGVRMSTARRGFRSTRRGMYIRNRNGNSAGSSPCRLWIPTSLPGEKTALS